MLRITFFYQVLRNTVVGGRVLDLPEKSVTKMYGSTILALLRGGYHISRKKCYVTLDGSLAARHSPV